jgi:hypothetical protein
MALSVFSHTDCMQHDLFAQRSGLAERDLCIDLWRLERGLATYCNAYSECSLTKPEI